MCLHRFGMTDEQFYDITPVELHHAFKDFEEVETNRIKIGYERMRLQTMYLVNTQLERNKQFKDPKRLMKFKWDELKQMSQQELVNKVKALATIFKGRVKVKKKKKE